MKFDYLKKPPFRLDAKALAWVKQTFGELSSKAKLGQLVMPLCLDLSHDNLDRFMGLEVGGLFRVASAPLSSLRASALYAQRRSAVPLLMAGDLEFAELGAVGGGEGTAFPNQMAVAAT